MPRTVLAVAHRIRRRARRSLRSAAGQAYRYDAQGRRVRSEVGGAQRRYSLYAQDGRLLWQRDEVAATRSVNVYLAGSLVAEYSRPLSGANASVGFLHTDPLGSPIAKTDATGAVVETSEYEPYGLLLNRANDDRAGYTGHVQDSATGLTYMQQRYYDPSIGRFLSVDPVTADTVSGWNFNRYNYAANNPYKFTDPDGRIIDTILDVGFIVYDVVQIARTGATATNMAALGADAASALIPGLTGGGMAVRAAAHADDAVKAAKVTARELRASGKADFAASKAKALTENGGKCNHCGAADATVGDHVKPLKAFANDVNSGTMTKADAVRQAHAPDNVVGSCAACNGQKGAKELSSTPGRANMCRRIHLTGLRKSCDVETL